MDGLVIGAIVVIAVALVFDYTNGFHDAANAIATSVSTRALTPRIALGMAAVGNFVGAHFGAQVAKTVGDGVVGLPQGLAALGVVLAGVLGAICWNLITWYFGLPSSSSHALIGGMVGATLCSILFGVSGTVKWDQILLKIVIPMVASPVAGFLLGALMMPLPIVFATPSPSRAPTRLKIAAISSATRGVSAPVETDVAIALAASWKPLV